MDYLAAAFLSRNLKDKPVFLVLAHFQAVTCLMARAVADYMNIPVESDRAMEVVLEQLLRAEIVKLVRKGLAADDGEPFPSDEHFREFVEAQVKQGLGTDTLAVGADACWDTPLSNVVRANA